MPALITAPGAPAAEEDPPDGDELVPLLPQAARIDPSSGTEIPTTVPRRMKSRRDRRPAADSSLMWVGTCPRPSRGGPRASFLFFPGPHAPPRTRRGSF